jgi:hypothetical protein
MAVHTCECSPDQACSCGRPKPRPSGAEVGQARSRLARLEAQATPPAPDDYEFVVNGRFDNAAGRPHRRQDPDPLDQRGSSG